MTDLVTLIKTAIENVPQRDGNGRIDTQSMAEAAAKVAVEEAANLADSEADLFETAARSFKENSEQRSRNFARARAARDLAVEIRSLLKQAVLA